MEKHLLWKIINENYDIKLNEEHFKYLSIEFIKQYQMVQDMIALGTQVDKTNLNVYSMIEQREIDLNYAKENPMLENENFDKALELWFKQQDSQRTIYEVRDILNRVSLNDIKGLETAKDKIDKLLHKESTLEIRDLQDVAKGQRAFMDEIFSGKDAEGLYLYSVNRKTSNQFMKLSYKLKYIANTDLVLIGGRPSVGKTSFVLSLMNVLAKNNYRGLYFSLEMTGEQNIHRMALAKSNISNDKIFGFSKDRAGNLTPEYKQLISDYTVGLHEIAKLPIKVIDNPVNSWFEIRQTIIDNKDNFDYIVIDHLTYIPSYDGNTNQTGHEKYSNIVRDMKQTAKEYEIPILLLGQLSRGASGHRRGDLRYTEPYAHDFRETGSIEEYADKIMMLYRRKAEDHEKWGIYKIACKVEKNRTGQTGDVDYWFYANTNRWQEIKEEEEKVEQKL